MPNSRIYAVGNHEFSRYCGFRKEKEHDAESVSMIQANVNYDISFSSHIVEGINFLSIDNSHYQFSQSQLEKLEAEITELQTLLGTEEVYTNATKLIEVQGKLAEKEKLLENAYERFEILDNIG
jgi:ATP-binding cassette subfamily F protein uup